MVQSTKYANFLAEVLDVLLRLPVLCNELHRDDEASAFPAGFIDLPKRPFSYVVQQYIVLHLLRSASSLAALYLFLRVHALILFIYLFINLSDQKSNAFYSSMHCGQIVSIAIIYSIEYIK